MKNISKTIVFFGTDDFSLITLENLVGSGYKVIAVVTKPDSKTGRGQQIEMPAVKEYALKNNIEVWQPEKVSEINNRIISLNTAVTGVLVSYGRIIPDQTLNLFTPGIINIHPSLLPKYRGPSPIESTIKNGDSITGVSVMQLTSKMDAGPVYGQIVHELSGTETRMDLRKTLARAGAMTLITLLPDILDNSIQPTPQNDDDASYCNLLTKNDSTLAPDEMTAVEAERRVRAFLDFPRTRMDIFGHNVVITKTHVSSNQKSPLDIKFKDSNYLSIDELVAPSGNKITGREFINGYS
ncbi:MAG TPA: methionyl-tRNA formyltransferase [Candidatus Saccharimonadales bacterium]|nr:methionyl-tRNA formyltransferase [Candidatus Saccharimonadales bacterium]